VRAVAFGAVVLLSIAPASQTLADCSGFDWSVGRERDWFADKKLPLRPSGSRLRRIDRAVEVELKPVSQVEFFLPPSKPPAAGTYAGEITFFGVPRPGLYQVSLSAPADVDVFENGARIKPESLVTSADCEGVRVSGHFELGAGDLVLLELTGVAEPKIKAAFAPAP
jgi:hypothetical protein